MKYDFLIKNGRVIDPARQIDQIQDIWIYNSKIVDTPESGLSGGPDQ